MWINIKKLRHVHCWRNWRNVEWWGPTDESNFDCYKFFWKRGAAQVMWRRPVLGEVDISWLKDDDYLEMMNDEVLQMSRILTIISFYGKGGRLKWCAEGLFWGKLIYPDWRMMIIFMLNAVNKIKVLVLTDGPYFRFYHNFWGRDSQLSVVTAVG